MRPFVAIAIVLILFAAVVARSQSAVPNPVLYLASTEPFTDAGKQLIRYNFNVENAAAFPKEFFAPSPDLPPCGTNKNSARTWVDLFDQRGKRLYGFCALGGPDPLKGIWFSLEADVVPPSWIYIELNDRKTSTKYKSNLAETTL